MERDKLKALFNGATAGILAGIGVDHLKKSFQPPEVEALLKMTLGEIADGLKAPVAQPAHMAAVPPPVAAPK